MLLIIWAKNGNLFQKIPLAAWSIGLAYTIVYIHIIIIALKYKGVGLETSILNHYLKLRKRLLESQNRPHTYPTLN